MSSPTTHDEWLARRRERAREGQRRRRRQARRIDYYASLEAAAAIDALRTRRAGGDASSIINVIISEWLAGARRNRN
jgi:hypothetical protein